MNGMSVWRRIRWDVILAVGLAAGLTRGAAFAVDLSVQPWSPGRTIYVPLQVGNPMSVKFPETPKQCAVHDEQQLTVEYFGREAIFKALSSFSASIFCMDVKQNTYALKMETTPYAGPTMIQIVPEEGAPVGAKSDGGHAFYGPLKRLLLAMYHQQPLAGYEIEVTSRVIVGSEPGSLHVRQVMRYVSDVSNLIGYVLEIENRLQGQAQAVAPRMLKVPGKVAAGVRDMYLAPAGPAPTPPPLRSGDDEWKNHGVFASPEAYLGYPTKTVAWMVVDRRALPEGLDKGTDTLPLTVNPETRKDGD
ncbi:MAG: hypothetical protein HYT87_14840 [Nitrospirae bacterium]|nr:hypothetical protein [Nitrospirota bacterium]